MPIQALTVRDLRRRWKPAKERLAGKQWDHPTVIRVHRAFSWMGRVETLEENTDLDIALVCRWIAFNSLYGQWNEREREPAKGFFHLTGNPNLGLHKQIQLPLS